MHTIFDAFKLLTDDKKSYFKRLTRYLAFLLHLIQKLTNVPRIYTIAIFTLFVSTLLDLLIANAIQDTRGMEKIVQVRAKAGP